MKPSTIFAVVLVWALPCLIDHIYAAEQFSALNNKEEGFALARKILQDASESANKITDRQERDFTFPEIAVSQGRIGDIAGALDSVDKISDLKSKACALGDIALAQATQNEQPASRDIFKKSLAVANMIADTYYQALVLAKLAELQATAQHMEGAKQSFQQALRKAHGVEEQPYRSNVLFRLGVSQVKLDRSEAIATMREASELLSKEGDFRAYVTAMELVINQANVGDYQGALRTAGVFSKDSTPHKQSRLLTSIAAVQAGAGDIEEALQTSAGIKDENLREEALSSIVEAQIKKGDVQQAIQIIGTIKNNMRAKVLSLLSLAHAQIRSGEPAEAKQTIDQALDSIPRMSQDDFENYPVIGIVRALIELGEYAKAETVATRIKLVPLTSVVVSDIANAYAKAGDRKTAEKLLKRALESPNRGFGLATIAVTYAEIGNVEAALETTGKIPREFDKTYALQRIADIQAQSGKINEAVKWAKGLKSPYLKASALLGAALGILQKFGVSPNISVL